MIAEHSGHWHPVSVSLASGPYRMATFDAAKIPTDWLRVARKLRSSANVIFEREKPIAAKALMELRRLLAVGKPQDLDI
jgi:hypothetical protein